MPSHDEAHRDDHVLDESLDRLAVTGPEFDGGLSNHGPMGAEALIRLGRAGDVEPWLDRFLRYPARPAPRATWTWTRPCAACRLRPPRIRGA